MQRNRAVLFAACALIVNVLIMFYVDKQGVPAAFPSPMLFCLIWIAFNLLCFVIYMRLRPK